MVASSMDFAFAFGSAGRDVQRHDVRSAGSFRDKKWDCVHFGFFTRGMKRIPNPKRIHRPA